MTGSPPSGPAPPHALRAGDHKRPPDPPNPGRKDPRLTHLPSPPSTPCAKRRRRGQGPSAAHTVGPRGPIPDPDAATGAAQKQRRTTEKRSTIRVSPSLTSPVPFRDDNALEFDSLIAAAGLVVLTQIQLGSGEAVGQAQGVGVVLA